VEFCFGERGFRLHRNVEEAGCWCHCDGLAPLTELRLRCLVCVEVFVQNELDGYLMIVRYLNWVLENV
jgi:hypothetical protein